MAFTEPQVILQLTREEAKALTKGINKNLGNPNLNQLEKHLLQLILNRLNEDLNL